ncbi:MAG: DUF58 domain-containing protein [Phycisphaerales bacterium]|nr:DUF58 domain-containing protein [Phycisphaerales bacterium]
MLTNELIRKIRRIEIRTRKVVSEGVAGRYLSAFKGRGMEFEEVRPYQIGDDVRSIDWNVSARVGSPHIKLFREEREMTVVLLVDLSGSMSFGTRAQLKRELIAEVAATLAFSAVRNNDKVALLAFTDRIERWLPPRKGRRHVLTIVRELLALKPQGRGTNIAMALDELNRVLHRKSVVFALSDWTGPACERPLSITSLRHDLIPLSVTDRSEHSLPNIGLVEMEDPESGARVVIDTGSRQVRERFAAFQSAALARNLEMFRRLNADPIELETGSDYVGPITTYFSRREARRSR